MKKLIPLLILAFVLILVSSAFAQPVYTKPTTPASTKPLLQRISTCTQTVDNAPKLRGLYLGMSQSAFYLLFKVMKVDDVDNVRLVSYSDFKDVEMFEGVTTLEAKFFERKLYALKLGYDNSSFKWVSSSEFAQSLSDSLNLPFSDWEFSGPKASMKCSGFTINIHSSNNTIELIDYRTETIKSDKEAKKEREKKKVFKP
jgi:hypothetical protein